MIEVTLTESEQALVRHIGNLRQASNRKHQVIDKKMGNQSNEDIDSNGFGGELAFCKAMNIYPDLTIVPGGGKEKIDARLRDGRTVDIKTTDLANGNLLAREIHDGIDLFVLVRGTLPKYDIVGYVPREVFIEQPKRDIGHGLTHFVHASNLIPMEYVTNPVEANYEMNEQALIEFNFANYADFVCNNADDNKSFPYVKYDENGENIHPSIAFPDKEAYDNWLESTD